MIRLFLSTTAATALLVAAILALGVVGGLAGDKICGVASWYGAAHQGKLMANGKPFNRHALTAAMWDVPFGTKYRVTYGSKSVVVTITDRGPARRLHRVIDLSEAAAVKIGMKQAGVGKVCLVRL